MLFAVSVMPICLPVSTAPPSSHHPGFVCDGVAYPSDSDKNPTVTVMALTWGAGDYIVEEAWKGNL